MMGPKKLSEIKRDLWQSLSKRVRELGPWLDRKIAGPDAKSLQQEVTEDLLWVRKILRASVKKRGSGKSKTTRAEKTPSH